jgi:pimeloyl-ACP methyl ester carboxylesterase
MKLDIVSHQGHSDNPAVVFIHGLGMDKNIWIKPSAARVLGGLFPLSSLLSKRTSENPTGHIQTVFDDLRAKGYSVITWSQKQPAGTINSVTKELHEIVSVAHEMTKSGIILIGHSRGGLIARKYLMRQDRAIKGLITIAAPHKGSSVARISRYLSPLTAMLNPFVPKGQEGTVSFAIRRIFEFLKSRALKELLPESSFFKSFDDRPLDWVYYASLGGTNPTLFSIYNVSFPDIFEKVMPENIYPEEMKKGKGDGLVSGESSEIPWAQEHHNFELNHAQILFDEGVRELLAKLMERMT